MNQWCELFGKRGRVNIALGVKRQGHCLSLHLDELPYNKS